MTKSKMQLTSETETSFWNDSCSSQKLSEAIQHGAVGATSNPAIVSNVIKQEANIHGKYLEQLLKGQCNEASMVMFFHMRCCFMLKQ